SWLWAGGCGLCAASPRSLAPVLAPRQGPTLERPRAGLRPRSLLLRPISHLRKPIPAPPAAVARRRLRRSVLDPIFAMRKAGPAERLRLAADSAITAGSAWPAQSVVGPEEARSAHARCPNTLLASTTNTPSTKP